MTTLYEDEFCLMCYDPQKGIHYHYMFPTTENMSEESFKDMLLTWLRTCQAVQSQKAIVFSKDLLFPIIPEIQEWIVNEIAPHSPIKRSAFIMPEDFIANLAIEQYIETANTAKTAKSITKYFSTVEQAEQWLETQ